MSNMAVSQNPGNQPYEAQHGRWKVISPTKAQPADPQAAILFRCPVHPPGGLT